MLVACSSGTNDAGSSGAQQPAATTSTTGGNTDAGLAGATTTGADAPASGGATAGSSAGSDDAAGTDAAGSTAAGSAAGTVGGTAATSKAATSPAATASTAATSGTGASGTASSTAAGSGTAGSGTAGSSTAASSSSADGSTGSSSSSSATASSTPPPKPTLLKTGSSGTEVQQLQQQLLDLGYWLETADGNYGQTTQQAVMAYQKAAGIPADGVAGPQTLEAIKQQVQPQPRTTSGDAIEIDLPKQLIYIVQGGELKYTINTSTGTGQPYTQEVEVDNPDGTTTKEVVSDVAITPTGEYQIQRGIDGMRKSKLGKLWRPRYFYEGWAIHGAEYIPNYPASHGCARMSNAAIDFIWANDLAPIGMKVWVY
nr:L,D-transpeptidase family protein [Nakamurella aerolata]